MNTNIPLIERIIETANAQDHSTSGAHPGLDNVVDELCQLGIDARLACLKSVYRVHELAARMELAARLIAAEPSLYDGIYREAVVELSGSGRRDDIYLLSEMVYIFDGRVPRLVLKSALVRAWKNAAGVLRENLESDLRRRGYRRLFGIWL